LLVRVPRMARFTPIQHNLCDIAEILLNVALNTLTLT
jgi:hypothetical protein